jgi:hypothetical protein
MRSSHTIDRRWSTSNTSTRFFAKILVINFWCQLAVKNVECRVGIQII